MRIAAIGDLHCTASSAGMVRSLLAGVEDEADVVVLAGDLANVGLPEEIEVLLRDLAAIPLPVIAVVGNHDHENDKADLLVRMMQDSGVCVLDCTSCEIGGVGFVGTKGFCGGFYRRRIATFGERALKDFVQESVDEAERLEAALATLTTERKVAVMHYSPIRETLSGESEELFPFLGTSRLADALDRFRVDVVFHGHAHHGSPQGHTPAGIPVYNVARFVLARYGHTAYYVHEV
jgi:Icc-related predicted phosphoesterase